ncbi:hypothetical protein FB561_6099 [Kribbella amoyensis]|uniref:Uncharacterized protein n=1 Tax=Kribbella amoyensis TaxID=996641 RepID=A0A561C141_9ACTN|nr:hypothetical protein FB561_6099 [Kribbella amoyensis]
MVGWCPRSTRGRLARAQARPRTATVAGVRGGCAIGLPRGARLGRGGRLCARAGRWWWVRVVAGCPRSAWMAGACSRWAWMAGACSRWARMVTVAGVRGGCAIGLPCGARLGRGGRLCARAGRWWWVRVVGGCPRSAWMAGACSRWARMVTVAGVRGGCAVVRRGGPTLCAGWSLVVGAGGRWVPKVGVDGWCVLKVGADGHRRRGTRWVCRGTPWWADFVRGLVVGGGCGWSVGAQGRRGWLVRAQGGRGRPPWPGYAVGACDERGWGMRPMVGDWTHVAGE